MAKEGVTSALKNVDKTKMLFAVGTSCIIGTGIASAKAAPEAARRIDEIKFDDWQQELSEGEHRTYRLKRYALEVAPLYIPAVIFGGTAIACFGISNKQLAVRAATATAAANVAERMLDSYSSKVVEEIGEEAERKIMQAVSEDVPEEVIEKARGYLTDKDVANMYPHMLNEKLFYDKVTGRLFWSTEEKILNAESAINKQIIDEQVATVNDFYAVLVLECDSIMGNAVGFDSSNPRARSMDIIFGSKRDEALGLALSTISYRTCAVFPQELERR